MRRLWAEREIILCGGAVNSPQLLMLSASSLGIPVVLDASEVGRNLQNHPSYALCLFANPIYAGRKALIDGASL